MKVQLVSTEIVVTLILDGKEMPARIWEGTTEGGVRCHAFITRIAVHKDDDATEFEKDLEEHAKPSMEIQAYPLRIVL